MEEEQKNDNAQISTLEEPVYATLWRDVRSIGKKLSLVLIPTQRSDNELRNWDLWGPLLFCLILCIMLAFSAKEGQNTLVFAGVFSLIWIGGAIITVNGQLLGGNLTFFQSECVIGYCIVPMMLCSIIFVFMRFWIIRLLLLGLCVAWSSFSAHNFLTGSVIPEKKALVTFPAVIFFIFLGYLILVM